MNINLLNTKYLVASAYIYLVQTGLTLLIYEAPSTKRGSHKSEDTSNDL